MRRALAATRGVAVRVTVCRSAEERVNVSAPPSSSTTAGGASQEKALDGACSDPVGSRQQQHQLTRSACCEAVCCRCGALPVAHVGRDGADEHGFWGPGDSPQRRRPLSYCRLLASIVGLLKLAESHVARFRIMAACNPAPALPCSGRHAATRGRSLETGSTPPPAISHLASDLSLLTARPQSLATSSRMLFPTTPHTAR